MASHMATMNVSKEARGGACDGKMMGIAMVFGLAAAVSVMPDRGSDALKFNYFVNDWNVVGLKDYDDGAR